MKMRQNLGIALFSSLMGMLGGQVAQAQPNDPTPFVQLLLARESNLIHVDTMAIAQQNRDIRTLNLLETVTPSAKVERMIRQLTIAIDRLQTTINSKTYNLQGLNGELNATLVGLPTPNPYTSLAASNAAIIASLASRPPFGVVPASASQ